MFVITGSGRGIGAYLTSHYSKNNLVHGIYNKTKPERQVIENYCKVDITCKEEVLNFALKIDQMDLSSENLVLINCSGINYSSFAHKSDTDKWGEVIDVNLKGTFNMINAILPVMRKIKKGRIVNLSSVVGEIGVMGTSCYAASKSALTGMIRSIAIENACHGITVNNLNLGYFNIGMIDEVPVDIQEKIKLTIPCKQFGDPVNIVHAIDFLISADYVNGTCIDINGGLK
jgi:acetoacetyl-CoA reductase/3-oxoacyl-[acyl-carrier protein] reductase